MRGITADTKLIAYCGLFCGACKQYLKERCPGCHDNVKAGWCKVRFCCMEHSYQSCADCTLVAAPMDCTKLNNIISKFFSFVFGSDRNACIVAIKDKGYVDFAREMAQKRAMSVKK